MRVTHLRRYPVKSFAGQSLDSVEVEPWGFAGDRRWALVDADGEKVTAREVNALLGLRAEQVDEDTIRIIDRDGAGILVETPLGLPPVPVSHSRQGFAAPADPDVNEWISERLGCAVRLVWQEEPGLRPISGAHGARVGESVSLADAGPVLLTTEASLNRLHEWMVEATGEPVDLDMVRFRPNLVVDGDEPFAEDDWPTLRVGEVEFRTLEVCDRCVMTTIDPSTLERGHEPIATLARHRRWEGATWFGTRLVPLGSGTVSLGDPVIAGG